MLYAELGGLHHYSVRAVLASQIPVGLFNHRQVLLEPLHPD